MFIPCPDTDGVLRSPTKCIYVFRYAGVPSNKERLYEYTGFTD